MSDDPARHALDVLAMEWADVLRDAPADYPTKSDAARSLERSLRAHGTSLADATLRALATLADVMTGRSVSEKDQMERPYDDGELVSWEVLIDLAAVRALAAAELARRGASA
jgi:hypothetical protein